jgi:glycosyltransferase involved in cell wall biosynthesis
MSLSVSIIVPAYNEERTIVQILQDVRTQVISDVHFEVIVVDDGSRDQTIRLLEANPQLYDKLIKQPKNGGKGMAVLAGLRAANGQYILFQDADLEYSPSHYASLIYPVQNFGAQIVIGSRFRGTQYSRVQFFWHRLGNGALTFLFNILFNTTFTDIYTGYLMYKRDLLDPDELVSMGWEQQAEILCRIVPRARVIYEVPVNYQGRDYAEGKKITALAGIPAVLMILRRRLFG